MGWWVVGSRSGCGSCTPATAPATLCPTQPPPKWLPHAADKDALSGKCAALSADLARLQAECAKQVEGLKEGLARELKRQRVRLRAPGAA